ncbi:MAG: BACON domain-containing protein [Bacteroidales bacterium]|nr:BACON domain-containing protein [Bacteroidales bacterium]
MKTNFILAAGLAVLLAAGCEEAMVSIPTLTVKSKTVELGPEASSKQVPVESNASWKVSTEESQEWLSAEKDAEGIVISALANPSYEEREGSVQVIAGTKTINITVTQEGSPVTISTDRDSLEATIAGLETTLALTSNVAWRAEVSDDWVTIGTAKGDAGTAAISVTVPEYTGFEERRAEIAFFFGYSKKTVVTVTQDAFVASLDVSETSFEADKAGGTRNITISANTDWTASCDEAWIALSLESGKAGQDIPVNITYLEASGSERNATVTFTAGNLTKTVAIHQDKGEAKLKDNIVIDMAFSNGTTVDKDVLTTRFSTTVNTDAKDYGVFTCNLKANPDYEFEFYSSYISHLIGTATGILILPAIVSGYTSKAIRPAEAFAYIKFPAIEGYKLAAVSVYTSNAASSSQKFPVYITTTYGTSNAEAIATALASSEDVGRKGNDDPTALNLSGTAANTSYYLFMPAMSGSTTAYQYQFRRITLTYKDANTPGL